ncbi:FAD-dependent oxidoreductase [Alkalihalobacillus sp. AL-G]|uniref:FAD-dependent oxidoreductase n=1 Tax=Alkalihalobacillus sp. AL-G TaxID=2926399 RepID=UPI002729D79D|nr:FAD-dependent oxidoreductase [Alkalihalobacillus sp. AL-G]WLD93288.1 FAD-dependent oxidoreductase [Alkalihalobacillus sp. AL-G]
MKEQHQMPQYPEPYWRDGIDFPSFDAVNEDQNVDVAIIGAGISGITTAYLLSKEGLKVGLIDAGKILNGTTGHTTAKISAQHDLIYDELIQHVGVEKAKLYYQSNDEALQFIKQIVSEKSIDCDLSKEDAYLYSTTEQYDRKIEKEWKAYEKLGIPGETKTSIPFDAGATSALVMKDQAQFHPIKYLLPLVKEIEAAGGLFFENTTAVDVQNGAKPIVLTREGFRITCNYVVSCSHFPFYDSGFYFARMYAERSYVVAVEADKEYPGGMYLSVDNPSRSLRSTPYNGGKLILIGAENHKTGQGINTMKHYEALQDWGSKVLGIKSFPYRWSTQDLVTLDKIPYIGQMSSKEENIFVATGYKKWGMTTSAVAARLITDTILRKQNPYKELYTPSRFIADPSLKNFLIQNVDVAGHLIAGKVQTAEKKVDELTNDEAAVVKVQGKRAGAYKDTGGNLHIVDTTCTHMGCECEWNGGDRTWDCPCHGSRYTVDGDVIEGPAEKPLTKINFN